MLIRSYVEGDEPAVVALWSEVFGYAQARNDPAKVLRDKLTTDGDGELVVVAERDDELVGTAMAGYDGHRGWLYRVAVAPTHRRHGLARALVAEAERRLQARGCAKVNLQVVDHDDELDAVSFWKAVGYVFEPRISLGKQLGG
ncbi:MAG: GNAT family acetyltransferase [Acidobacteriota bacterium]